MIPDIGHLVVIPNYFVLLPAAPLAVWILRRKADPRWTLLALIALGHATAIVGLTIFPIPIGGQEFYRHTRGMSGDNVVPFATIVDQLSHLSLNNLRQVSGNLLLLTPFGVYGPKLWPALRDWRRFVVVALAIGCAIEVTQYIGSTVEGFSYRITDIDDAIMNAAGAVAALLAWQRIERSGVIERWRHYFPDSAAGSAS